jgi:hypothetical protein
MPFEGEMMFRQVEIALERPLRQRISSSLQYRLVFLLQFFLFFFSLLPLQVMVARFLVEEARMRERVGSPSFSVPLLARATDVQIVSFRDALLRLPYVATVTHVTREQAYEAEMGSHPDVAAFFEDGDLGNPFTDTITVELTSLKDLQAFQTFLERQELSPILPASIHFNIRMDGERLRQELLAHLAVRRLLVVVAIAFTFLLFVASFALVLLRIHVDHRAVLLRSMEGAPLRKIAQPIILETITLLGTALIITSVLVAGAILFLPALFPARIVEGSPTILADVRSTFSSVGVLLILLEFLLFSVPAAFGVRAALRSVMGRESAFA